MSDEIKELDTLPSKTSSGKDGEIHCALNWVIAWMPDCLVSWMPLRSKKILSWFLLLTVLVPLLIILFQKKGTIAEPWATAEDILKKAKKHQAIIKKCTSKNS